MSQSCCRCLRRAEEQKFTRNHAKDRGQSNRFTAVAESNIYLWPSPNNRDSVPGELGSRPIRIKCIRVKGQLAQELTWKRTDSTDRITFPANAVDNITTGQSYADTRK